MALDKNSNGFTFGFSIIMVIVVGAGLAIAAMALKPIQQDNIKQEKMKNILMAVDMMKAEDDMKAAPDIFNSAFSDRYLIDTEGKIVDTKSGKINAGDKMDPFNIDVNKEYKKFIQPILNKYKGQDDKIIEELVKEKSIHYPIFKHEGSGVVLYVVPMAGTGLWGPIWGYLGIDEQGVVYAAVFDHKTETPGLGAEIKEGWFQKPFKGKMIFDENGNYQPIMVIKGGADPDDKHSVDAITGGTLTSKGLEEMLKRTLHIYSNFFKTLKK